MDGHLESVIADEDIETRIIALCARAKLIGLSIREWGRRAGTAPSAIHRWRSNQLSPRLDTMRRLNAVLCEAELEAKQVKEHS
jgi:predicted transcriptional regulator